MFGVRSRYLLKHDLVFPKHFLLLFSLGAVIVSCQREERPVQREPSAEAVFERTKGALVEIYLDLEIRDGRVYSHLEQARDEKGRHGSMGVGFFVSQKGMVLTVAHHVPTTHGVVVVYTSEGGTSYSVGASCTKRDDRLDLALLDPDRPILPAKFLQLDTEHMPTPGQRVAIMTVLLREAHTRKESYFVNGVLPATVFAVFREGLFATDIYPFSRISGSPVLDLTTERVIGVCTARSRAIEPFPHTQVPVPMADGTTVSMPALYIVYNYAVARSLASAQDFLSDLR